MSDPVHKQAESYKLNQKNDSTETSSQPKEKKESSSDNSLRMAMLGGAVGAGIGWFANRENSKRVLKNFCESEFVKTAGQEFKKTALEIVSGQAQSSIKQIASGYLGKYEKNMDSPKSSASNNSVSQKQPNVEIKEENKNINERLQKLEEMLGALVESK